ncbi:MAG TPA: hypothetical protein VLK30_00770 [Candidatus Limnocylindrales bacterium]|nr:hypothetical protein [Candidatus Limnocylindrales bacterium]
MIFFVSTRPHRYTMQRFLEQSRMTHRLDVRVMSYETLFTQPVATTGTYLFADLERLAPAETEMAATACAQLRRAGARTLNHPARSMLRYELLRHLAERRINTFDVYRLTEARAPVRYPVFLRQERWHSDVLSPLLTDAGELAAAIERVTERGINRDGVLITEFCDTADASGVYRKYSAFRIGSEIIPAHLYFSRQWMFRRPDTMPLDAARLEEEMAYVRENPHAQQLREVFELACIQFGRIDYGVSRTGGVQVWEIGTNPTLTEPVAVAGREAAADLMRARIAMALQALDSGGDRAVWARLRVAPRRDPTLPTPREEVVRMGRTVLRRARLTRYETAIKRPVKAVLRLVDRSTEAGAP